MRRRFTRPAATLPGLRIRAGIAGLVWLGTLAACGDTRVPTGPAIDSLDTLSISALRGREYGAEIRTLRDVADKPYPSQMVSYDSDGLSVFARFDRPRSPPPAEGYPVVVFCHGWVGIEAAPGLDFYYAADSNYGAMIDAYVDAGFAVFTPGFRGHGTESGVAADGIEFLEAWDNGSYLSPVFYAIDVLNLLDSLDSIADINRSRVNLVGHSQGGDVVLIALAVAGEGSRLQTPVAAASIWSGTFASRFTQLETYAPMGTSPEAFLAGDGTWTGTAVGHDGSVNPRFVFGYPADRIETVDPGQWTWQRDVWSAATTVIPLRRKLDEIYGAINSHVRDIDDASYTLTLLPDGRVGIEHDPRVAAAMQRIGGYDAVRFLTEPLVLQHSDRDFYSFPEWNADLCRRVNAAGGACQDFEYAGNDHSLRKSTHEWFSPPGVRSGFELALRRDIALFLDGTPAATPP